MTKPIDKTALFTLAWRYARKAGGDVRKAFGEALKKAWGRAKLGMVAFELRINSTVSANVDYSGVKLGRWNGSSVDMGGRRSRRYVAQGSYGGGIYRE